LKAHNIVKQQNAQDGKPGPGPFKIRPDFM